MYGDEDQNDLMRIIKEHKEEGDVSMENKIKELEAELNELKQTADDALSAAENVETEIDELVAKLTNT